MRLTDLLGVEVVGGRGIGARLGYQRRKVKGPWLVKLLFRRLAQDGRYVEARSEAPGSG